MVERGGEDAGLSFSYPARIIFPRDENPSLRVNLSELPKTNQHKNDERQRPTVDPHFAQDLLWQNLQGLFWKLGKIVFKIGFFKSCCEWKSAKKDRGKLLIGLDLSEDKKAVLG